MVFSSWLRNRIPNRARRAQPRRPAPRFRPQLEALEGRCVPSTLKVTNLGDGGKGSLRYEIAQAQSNDTIVFAKKLDGGTISLSSGAELYIGKNLTIQGPGAGLLTVSAQPVVNTGTSRIFEVAPGATVTLGGLTISHGGGTANGSYPQPAQNDGEGGAILSFGTLTIKACVLSNNTAWNGGAIYNANFATLMLSGCTVSNNSNGLGPYGGGIYNAGTLTVSGGTISNNSNNSSTNGEGGGIYNAGRLTISGCTLSGNSAGYEGGGIFNFSASYCTVSNCLFSGNTPDNIFGPYTDGGGNTFG